MTAKSPRDGRIDLIRGYAMLTITVNHFGWLCTRLGYDGPIVHTLTHYGYSSAAEIFFLVSGYLVGLIYFNRPDTARGLLARAWRIYTINLALFAAVILICLAFGQPLSGLTGTGFTIEHPLEGTALFLVLAQAPVLLDVLQLYVVLILVAAGAASTLKTRPGVVLGVSALVYVAANVFEGLNLPGGPPAEDFRYNLNPFAYQALFIFAIAAGRARAHERLTAWVENGRVEAAAYALLALSVALFEFQLVPDVEMLRGRTNLGLLRIGHALLVLLVLFSILKRTRALADTLAFRLVAAVGRQSLSCYVASCLAVYALAGLSTHRAEPASILAMTALAVAIVIAVAIIRERVMAARKAAAA